MPDLWRISNHQSLSGEGGWRYSARWHTAGRRIVYLAETPAGALLEVLVHLEISLKKIPPNYTLLRISIPQDAAIDEVAAPSGSAWKTNLIQTRKLGNKWLDSASTSLARVPSVIVPETFNYLLNPVHADAQRITVTETIRARFDPRLMRYALSV